MAKLNDDNWREIDNRIKTSTNIRWLHWFKTWGTAGAFITGCVAVAIFVAAQMIVNSKFQGATEEHLKSIDKSLTDMRALVASSQPTRKLNQNAATELLAEARQGKISAISLQTVDQAGQSFTDGAKENPGAWKVALQFANYRSSLNAGNGPPGPVSPLPLDTTWKYELDAVPGTDLPRVKFPNKFGVPEAQAARLDRGTDNNLGTPVGPAYLVIESGAIEIGGLEIHNVFLEGVEVHYSGKPVILQNVVFINCTFVFENTDSARELVREVLAASKVNFPKA